jgi:hypothetical protein
VMIHLTIVNLSRSMTGPPFPTSPHDSLIIHLCYPTHGVLQDGTVGTHLCMAAAELGSLSLGTLLGGIVVSIAKGACTTSEHASIADMGGVHIVPTGPGYWGRDSCEIGVLCALAALVAVPLAACRPVYAPGMPVC